MPTPTGPCKTSGIGEFVGGFDNAQGRRMGDAIARPDDELAKLPPAPRPHRGTPLGLHRLRSGMVRFFWLHFGLLGAPPPEKAAAQ